MTTIPSVEEVPASSSDGADGVVALDVGAISSGEAATTFDDDDDWSRRVETDEVPQVPDADGMFRTESVPEQANIETSGSLNLPDSATLSILSDYEENETERSPELRPSRRALTMKEKLVLRERERRIETERARLKRQFALSNNQIEEEEQQQHLFHQALYSNGELNGDGEGILETGDAPSYGAAYFDGAPGSVATLGEESILVHADDDSNAQSTLPVTMERFLRNSDSFNSQLHTIAPHLPAGGTNGDNVSGGVLMERLFQDLLFINDQRNVEPSSLMETQTANTNVNRSVSFDVEQASNSIIHQTQESSVVRQSMQTHAALQGQPGEYGDQVILLDDPESSDDAAVAIHEAPSSTVSEEPRVLRLTEAHMQEMAATEEESIANYPPSERDDNLSEVGELADFGIANPIIMRGDISQDTPTTAVESASIGHWSEKPPSAVSSDRHSEDGVASINYNISTQPPYEHDIPPPIMDVSTEQMKVANPRDKMLQRDTHDEPEIVNRRIPPGIVSLRPTVSSAMVSNSVPSEELRVAREVVVVVENFDFDKDAPKTPESAEMNDSFQNLPDDPGFSPELRVTPLTKKSKCTVLGMDLGIMEEGQIGTMTQRDINSLSLLNEHVDETAPLLGGVPPEIITTREDSPSKRKRSSALESLEESCRRHLSAVLNDVRADLEDKKGEINQEFLTYSNCNSFRRAFPERLYALAITLLLEIPVFFIISNGSDVLCQLVGRKRYQLLVSFIPLTSAISGNVGLQASALTTRAISHQQVTMDSLSQWFIMEIGASFFLGIGMGCLSGALAYLASQRDYAFAWTIFTAQFVSIVAAGFTGTIAPLLFRVIFQRNSGKWVGLLETAIQDVVASCAMVILSYHILRLLGPWTIEPEDVCGVQQNNSIT